MRELKRGDGPELLTQGSADLMRQLLATDVVDELRLLVHPILLGRGKRLLDDTTQASAFRLDKSKVAPTGVVVNRYVRDGAVRDRRVRGTIDRTSERPAASPISGEMNLTSFRLGFDYSNRYHFYSTVAKRILKRLFRRRSNDPWRHTFAQVSGIPPGGVNETVHHDQAETPPRNKSPGLACPGLQPIALSCVQLDRPGPRKAMQAENWQRVRALFELLADLAPAEWEAALDGQGVADPLLRHEVITLLQADRKKLVHTDIDSQAPGVLSDLAQRESEMENQRLDGRTVGAFRLVEEIGRGGMGTVWRAERVEGGFEQVVAIKLIRPGWDAAEMIRRFRAERQILAHLSHPNIAHLIDGGITDDERPWLALEYVDGIDLRSYCDQHKLDIEQRLKLFMTVCDAVSHAHAHLIVHRDLKPSNLLVTRSGEIKLLDFGIAKLVDGGAIHASIQRVFTPEYAAPEQVRGDVITTSVDVYALGLLLYELLTGRRPYNIRNSTPAAYERAILDQEPTRPSLAFEEVDDVGDIDARAARLELSPQQMRRELRGDIDAIILKALRKQPEQRYASVADFADDIRNHLAKRPVIARRGGWRYRATRFLRRHALAAILGSFAVAALVAGLGMALWQAKEARVQRDLARSEGDKSRQTVQFLLDIFRSADPAATKGEKITAEELLNSGAERAEYFKFKDPAVHFDLLTAMGEAYIGIGASRKALPLFERALEVQESQLPGAVEKRVHALILRAAARGGVDDVAGGVGDLDEAARLLPAELKNSEMAANLLMQQGIIHMTRGDTTGAISHMSRGSALLLKIRGATDYEACNAAIKLSWAYIDQDMYAEARALLEPIISALRTSNANPSLLADALSALANTYTTSSDAVKGSQIEKEALDITRRLYGDSHAYVAMGLNNLAYSLMRSHDYLGANTAMKEAVATRRKLVPPGSQKMGNSLYTLALTEYALGHWADAEKWWKQTLEIRRQTTDVPSTANTLRGLAGAAREQGNLADARGSIDEALALIRAHPSPRPTHLARILIERTEVDLAFGIVDCTHAEEAVALMEKNSTAEDPQRLYTNAVAAGCALRAVDNSTNRQRVVAAQSAMRAEFPADAALLKQAQRYAIPKS